jgi:hypothetical protein
VLRILSNLKSRAQDSRHHIFGQMVHVLRLGPELLPAGNAARNYNAVAALGHAGRVINECVPLVASDLRLCGAENLPFRFLVHEIEDSARHWGATSKPGVHAFVQRGAARALTA